MIGIYYSLEMGYYFCIQYATCVKIHIMYGELLLQSR